MRGRVEGCCIKKSRRRVIRSVPIRHITRWWFQIIYFHLKVVNLSIRFIDLSLVYTYLRRRSIVTYSFFFRWVAKETKHRTLIHTSVRVIETSIYFDVFLL